MYIGHLTGNIVSPNINDDRTRFKPVSLDELGFSNGRYHDIATFDLCGRHNLYVSINMRKSRTDDALQVLSPTVTLCYSSVAFAKHSGNRASHDVATSQDDSIGPCNRNAGGFNQADNTCRGAGAKKGR